MVPLITIGITAFNCEGSIKRAIQSALAQQWERLEVVVVDDASTDRTLVIANEVGATDPRVKVLSHETNRGVAAARNSIIAIAQGEFLAFFDDDDESDLVRLSEQWHRIIAYELAYAAGAPVICHTARIQLSADGSQRIEKTMGCNQDARAPSGPAVAARILWGEPLEEAYGAVATCSQMARTTTYKAVGGFDPAFRRSEDTELCVKLALAGGHFVGIDQPLVWQTLTRRMGKTFDNERYYKRLLLGKYKALAPSKAHYDFSCRWLELKTSLQKRDWKGLPWKTLSTVFLHPVLAIGRLRQAFPHLARDRSLGHFQRSEGA